MSRFPSIKYAPSETRRLLRDRFNRKLRVHHQTRHVAPGVEVMSDQMMLRLLQVLDVSFEAEWTRAEAVYAAANPSSAEPNNLKALADAGWVRVIWGRVVVARNIRQAARRATGGPMIAFQTLLDRIYKKVYRRTQAAKSESDLTVLIDSIETGKKDPIQIICQTPAWVAGRLWETKPAESEGEVTHLRRWVDQWGILRYPALVPGDVWCHGDAESFRMAAVAVISSEAGLGGWSETRCAYAKRAALGNNLAVADAESRFPELPATLVGRALWLGDPVVEHSSVDSLEGCNDVFGLVRLLFADVVADDNPPAPHPMAVRLIDLAIDRAELFLYLLFQIRANPTLLADLLLHPPSTALACLLVAEWRSPMGAWDRSLAERDDRIAQTEAFADAASILGEYLLGARATPIEAAALLNWFHDSAGPGFIDDVVGNDVLLATLRRELGGVTDTTLRAMAESLDGPELRRGLGASEFAAVLDLVDFGGLAADLEPSVIVEAYVQSIRAGEYDLTAHRVGVGGAAALAQLAARTPKLRQAFLCPLQVRKRLAAATPNDNMYTLAGSIGRSIRAHIRILCRALVGSRDDVPSDLVDALVATVRVGALEHKEKGRVAAFAPRFEQSIIGPVRDRPLAVDLGAAMGVVSGEQQKALLDAILETDEPLILAQLLSFGPPVLRARIDQRITALSPTDAGAIQSLTEIQARIDELLTAGAADAAARYMDAEAKLQTLGQPPGRELVRFQNQLRLHYLREEWSVIASTPWPAFQAPSDQTSAENTLKLYWGFAALKGPTPNPQRAKTIFADLFARRPAAVYAINWFAAECSRLLQVDSFGLLKGTDVREGHRALAELERMLEAISSVAPLNDEVMECNKALLLLAMGQPSQALAVLTSIPIVRLQDTAAAYRAIALARLGQRSEAIAGLDAAEHIHGVTKVLAAARANITSGTGFLSVPDVSFENDLLHDVVSAIARFRNMDPENQARVLYQCADPFEGLVVDNVRAAADSVVSLVPMMKGVRIDAIEDDLTAFIQQLLAARVNFFGWSLSDQSRGGFTSKGNPGERDLLLMRGATTLAVIEAVICDKPLTQNSMRANLESHFQKLFGYADCRLYFHLTYAYLEDKESLMTFLEGIAESATPPGLVFKGRDPISRTDSRPPGFVARYYGEFGEVKVIFLVLNLGQQRQRRAAKVADTTKGRKAPKRKGGMSRRAL